MTLAADVQHPAARSCLAMDRASIERHELVAGVIVGMAGASYAHNVIVASLVAADRTSLRGEATLQEGVAPMQRALGGPVADADGFWPLHQAAGWSRMQLRGARLDARGGVTADKVLPIATGLSTRCPFRPYLAAYGHGQPLAGWQDNGQLSPALLDGCTGAVVDTVLDRPAQVDAPIDPWAEFVSFPDGSVGWAHAPGRGGGERMASPVHGGGPWA